MQVLSALDAAFLRLETPAAGLHIASVAIFDGPAPPLVDVAALYASRLALIPRYRQRVREVPLWLGRPVWVDDPDFDLSGHLHERRLPDGGIGPSPVGDELNVLVGELMSSRLDRRRPLWQAWLVTGLAEDRWALINKVHHCVVDGIAGTDLLTTLLDVEARPTPDVYDDWQPPPEPGSLALLGTALDGAPHLAARVAHNVATAARHPRVTADATLARVQGLFGFATAVAPVGSSFLTGRLGAARGWRPARVPMAEIDEVRDGLGGTVNDVVLSAITSGFRRLIGSRGVDAAAVHLRSLVPVSVRTPAGHGRFDNELSAMIADLPVAFDDPVERYEAMRLELDRLKHSGEPPAGELLVELGDFAPALLVNAGLAAAFRLPQRSLVTVTTNVPGPRRPLYALGRRMVAIYPYVPIADRLRVGIAITSYQAEVTFGVTGDRASMPDLGVLAEGIESGLGELVGAVRAG